MPISGFCQPMGPPQIEWQKTFGGAYSEYLLGVEQLLDGGFVLAGFSDSRASGNKSSLNFGGTDYWIVRLDASGQRLWDQSFGGAGSDENNCVQQTADGGFILGGSSSSDPGGNKISPHFGSGFNYDFWVVRLDASGAALWDRSFGGTGEDQLNSLQQTVDGGFVLGGSSASGTNSHKNAPNLGGHDFWIVRLDANGDKLWDQSFGGASSDILASLKKTQDGGFILGGASSSDPGGNKTSPHFGPVFTYDFWVIRLDPNGNKLWEKTFGGSGDDFVLSTQETADGGFIVGGMSDSSPGGNKTSPNYGSRDFWVVRLDASGNKLWEQSFGGSGDDRVKSLQQTVDGGFLLGGMSTSGLTGNKSTPGFGGSDFWVVRLDALGNKLWEQSYGGAKDDELHALQQTADGGFILSGHSFSGLDGNKTAPNVDSSNVHNDFWVIKLEPDEVRLCPLMPSLDGSQINGYRFLITGPAHACVIEFSTDLQDWIPLQTNSITSGGLEIIDSSPATVPRRFYRARLSP